MFSLIPQYETLLVSQEITGIRQLAKTLVSRFPKALKVPWRLITVYCCRPSSFFFCNIFHLKKGRPIQPRSMVSERLNGITTSGNYAARGVDKAAAKQTSAVFSILPKQS